MDLSVPPIDCPAKFLAKSLDGCAKFRAANHWTKILDSKPSIAFQKFLAKMSSYDRPFQDSQDATFMGIEPHNSMHASTVASVPDAVMGFSACFAPLLHYASPDPGGTARSHSEASEQTASLIDMDLWVEPPVAPGSAAVADAQHHLPIMLGIGPATEAPPCLCEQPQHNHQHKHSTQHDAWLSDAQRRPEHASILSI